MKKSHIPLILIIMGVLGLVIPLFTIGLLLPNIVILINNVENTKYGFLAALPVAILIGIFLSQIFYGIRLSKYQKKAKKINLLQRRWGIILIILGSIGIVITIPTLIYSIISPLYGILSEIR